MSLVKKTVACALAGAAFGFVADKVYIAAGQALADKSVVPVTEKGLIRSYVREKGHFVDDKVMAGQPKLDDQAVLYCFQQTHKLYVGRILIDHSGGKAMMIMRDRNADLAERAGEAQARPTDFHAQATSSTVRSQVNADLTASCAAAERGESTGWRVNKIAAALGA
jgi:hypothetical protein